jgi:hypothetical protein
MSFLQLVAAVMGASTYPYSDAVAKAANGKLAAFIVANGPQTLTDTNSGLTYNWVAYGSYPGYRVVPG